MSCSKRSAIPLGRMKKTDQVKGSECPIPNSPGIYRHIDKGTGEVDYVGQTENLRVRQQHVPVPSLARQPDALRQRQSAGADTAPAVLSSGSI